MKKHLPPAALLALTATLLTTFLLRGLAPPARLAAAERPHGLDRRVPWTTSRVSGSPEPPHPFKIERAFPKLQFKNPLLMARAGDRFFVGEHARSEERRVGKECSSRGAPYHEKQNSRRHNTRRISST